MDRQQLTTLSEAYIRNLLQEHLPAGTPFYLYGSRARQEQRWNSDYDLWIDGETPVSVLVEIDELLEESFVPFKVDIITSSRLQGRFGDQVRQDSMRWM